MTRDQRLFFHSIREETRWETIQSFALLCLSFDARKTNRRYQRVHAQFAAAFSDPDSVYELQTRRLSRSQLIERTKWALLAVLVIVSVLEWGIYSGPSLSDWCHTILHKCGLR